MTRAKHWASLSERGSVLGIRIVVACFRFLGERAARVLLYPVVAYFLVTGSAARRASNQYFAHLRSFAGEAAALPPPGWRTAFRHMMAFAESALHKFAAWLGKIDDEKVTFPEQAELQSLLASGKGALLIGAHLGNLELTRALAAGGRKAAVNAVVYVEHGRGFFDALAKANPDFSVNLIHVAEVGPGTSIELKDKVDRGELLVIVGDRTPPNERGRTCTVDFLGAPAQFAKGPFILAALLECPVYLFFCLKEEDGSYRIHLERFAERVSLPRAEREARLRELAQRYAHRLEAYCLKAPYQWFNFYDYWEKRAA
jgi:predicted LPLAT superfamily acyltransferase